MRRSQHLQQNKYGVYCFRYTFPQKFAQKHPSQPKAILLSLKTKDKMVAIHRVQQLWLMTTRLMRIVDADGIGGRVSDISIEARLKAFRNRMEHAEVWEQEEVYWGQPQFEEIIGHFGEQLEFIKEYGSLKLVDDDFRNIEDIYQSAMEFRKKLLQAEVDADRDERLAQVRSGPQQITNGLPEDSAVAATKSVEIENSSLKLSDILCIYTEYCDTEQDIGVKTAAKTQQHFQLLIETVGDKAASHLIKADANNFMRVLGERKVKRNGTLQPISTTTKNDVLASCSKVLKHANERVDDAVNNVFASSAFRFRPKRRGRGDTRERKPFSSQDLRKLFSQPTHTQGDFLHPYEYWIPLLGLYTSKRSNELCQLHVADVSKVNIGDGEAIWCISINENAPDKRLKTGKEQLIPVHPHLIKLGFSQFVELLNKRPYRHKDSNGYYRLFTGLTHSERDGYQKNFSRWFNGNEERKSRGKLGFKQAVGIESDGKIRKDFHSFRHTCATELRRVGVADSLAFEITGHEFNQAVSNDVAEGYRHEMGLRFMYDAICKLDFSDELKAVKPFFDVCEKNRLRPKVKSKR